jgi:hypothetical protein
MQQDHNPRVDLDCSSNIGSPNWRESAIAAIKARKRAGITIGELVESVYGGMSQASSVYKNARIQFEAIVPELVELGVVVQKGVRYHWWRFAK